MSDKEPMLATVAVPVELLRELLLNRDDGSQVYADVEALLSKPKPRLVAVSHEQWIDEDITFDLQPDLLTLLDEVIENSLVLEDAAEVKAGIRTALGVTE